MILKMIIQSDAFNGCEETFGISSDFSETEVPWKGV